MSATAETADDVAVVVCVIEPIVITSLDDCCSIELGVLLSGSVPFLFNLFRCLRRFVRTSSVKVSLKL